MPILWKSLVSGFTVSALFALFARSPGFDWAPTLSFVALYALIAFARIRYRTSLVAPRPPASQFSRGRPF